MKKHKRHKLNSMISLPSPPPAPIPGGGPQDGYQFQFNLTYMKSRRSELQPFFYGRPGAEPGNELTPDEKLDLADRLYNGGAIPTVPFDQQIEAWSFDPYSTMYERFVTYHYTRVPYGTGRFSPKPPVVVDPADLVGPVVPGYLLVSVDIKDFPPYKA